MTLAAAVAFAQQYAVHAAGSISVQATDLADATPGQDLWRFTYLLDGFDFQANQGFSVFFNYLTFADLHNASPSSSSIWNAIAVQPDALLQADGFFDAQALVNSPSAAIPFSVDFVWLGAGRPGPQSFYTYDTNFRPIVSGSTIVPEPDLATLSGAGAAVAALGGCLRGRRNRNQPK